MDWVVWQRKGLGLTARPLSAHPDALAWRASGFKSFSLVGINKKTPNESEFSYLRRKGLEPSWNYFH